jgi:outer membrane protein OmpA-like peptidoglycan-associated protein
MKQISSIVIMQLLIIASISLVFSCKKSTPPRPTYAMDDRGSDSDGDGIADLDDPCRNRKEDGLPPKANDGCPHPDPDNDKISWKNDKCPYKKEDGLLPNKSDGCPTTDSDQDGVGDAIDKCPNELEDNLAPSPNDGCKAPDSDGDGILDPFDRCPSIAENINSYQDWDGCPDTKPTIKPTVAIRNSYSQITYDKKRHIIYIPGNIKIAFETNSAKLQPLAIRALSHVAKIINKYSIDRIEIEGHASKKGNAYDNLKLTKRRTRSVIRELIKNGVSRRILIGIGYGEYCPRVNTTDESDDQRNRRVELKIVKINGKFTSIDRGCYKALLNGINPVRY